MKLHWGHAITLVMLAFVAIMVQFAVRAINNPESLVAEDYYALELRYQEQIEKLGNVAALERDVRITVADGFLELHFPEVPGGERISGEMFLMRPSDARFDRRAAVVADAAGKWRMPTSEMLRGAYRLQLEWRSGGTAFLTEDQLYLP
jgi:hypothetical protein